MYKRVFEFIKTRPGELAILFIVIWIVFIKSGSTYGAIISQNQLVLQIAIVIFLVLVLLKSWLKISTSTATATFGILLALVFFMHQNFSVSLDKIQSLQIITNTNCELSKQIINSISADTVSLDRFSINVYVQNEGFILNTFGLNGLKYVDVAKNDMAAENRILDLIDEFRVVGQASTVESLQKSLRAGGQLTKTALCDNLEPLFGAKSPELANISFIGATYTLIKNIF